MAIVKTGDMYGQVGRLGQNVYYTAYSETRSRKLAASVTNPRTRAQMLQRIRWANPVNFYRVNKEWMKYAFETKKKNQSEYNKFMSLNVAKSPIYLTKQEAGGGACVVYPYIITQGSLPNIGQNFTGNAIKTNLFLPLSFRIGQYVLVSEISNALVESNPALRYGDQISVIRLYQQTNPNTGIPFVVLRKYELVLSATNTNYLSDYWPLEIIGSETTGETNSIVVDTTGRVGGISFVLSRTISGKTYVSTQRIVTAGMDNTIQYYSSENQLQTAINSYGDTQEAFLTSTYASRTETNPVQMSILGISIDGVDVSAGGYAAIEPGNTGFEVFSINFNAAVGPASELQGVIETSDGTILLTGGTGAGNSVGFEDVAFASSDRSRWIRKVSVTINGTQYEATFSEIIRNEDTLEGLE